MPQNNAAVQHSISLGVTAESLELACSRGSFPRLLEKFPHLPLFRSCSLSMTWNKYCIAHRAGRLDDLTTFDNNWNWGSGTKSLPCRSLRSRDAISMPTAPTFHLSAWPIKAISSEQTQPVIQYLPVLESIDPMSSST